MQMLSYVSESLIPTAERGATVRQLMRVAQEKNAALGISGVLFLRGNVFFQTIEGPKCAVNDVFGSIVSDPRHQSICLLANEPIEKRRFSGWSMECFHEHTNQKDYVNALQDLEYHFRHEEQFSASNVYAYFEEMALSLERYRLPKAA